MVKGRITWPIVALTNSSKTISIDILVFIGRILLFHMGNKNNHPYEILICFIIQPALLPGTVLQLGVQFYNADVLILFRTGIITFIK